MRAGAVVEPTPSRNTPNEGRQAQSVGCGATGLQRQARHLRRLAGGGRERSRPGAPGLYETDTTFRQIFTDGRTQHENPQPAWLGYSVGKWDGDWMVVDTIGFNDQSGWTLRAPDPRHRSDGDIVRKMRRTRRIWRLPSRDRKGAGVHFSTNGTSYCNSLSTNDVASWSATTNPRCSGLRKRSSTAWSKSFSK